MLRDLLLRLSLLPAILGPSAQMLLAETSNWNQFRGPSASGRGEAEGLPLEFDDQRNVLWKTPVHGKGWSSPVLWNDQIWMTTASEEGTKLHAICVNLHTGDIEHDVLVFEVSEPEFCHPTNSYASCTPFLEEGRVYVHFGTYGTACLDALTGEKLWERRDLNCDHYRGPASSPIVHGDMIFLTFDGVDVQFVAGLDKSNGNTVWQRDRNIDYGTDVGDYKKAYSTPAVIRVEDQWQLISPAAVETIAYDPSSGRELWRIRHGGMNAAAPPLYEHGLVYLSSGHGKTLLLAANPNGRGEITRTAIEWSTGLRAPKRSTPLIVDNLLFMVSDDGVASCLDALTGEKIWSKRLSEEHWASPVYANGLIYASSKAGTVTVFEAGPKFVLRAKNQFPDGFNATPAIADNSLLLRSFTHLYRIGK